MTSLPVADAGADIVISNWAISLSEEKERVLAEAYRILRPGGQLQITDMVKDLSAGEGACCSSDESWADCVSGTLEPNTFMMLGPVNTCMIVTLLTEIRPGKARGGKFSCAK